MRKAQRTRKTTETEITVNLNIDGEGKAKIDTPIGLLNHMLELFAFHGLFDLEITAKGDLKVDSHHTNEDIGIVLGQVFKEALGDKAGINRTGFVSVPMEEVVATVVVDISGRGSYKFESRITGATPMGEIDYTFEDAKHFFEAFAQHSAIKKDCNYNQKRYADSKDSTA